MRISSVNSNSIHFAQIKKSAVKNAIKFAKGDVKKLERVKELLEEQKDNDKYHVIARASYTAYGYSVINNNGNNMGVRFLNLSEACNLASILKRRDEASEDAVQDKQNEEFSKLAKELLNSCDE